MKSLRLIPVVCFVLLCDVFGEAPVYNIRLLTDQTPDLTDIPRYLRSITSQHATPHEQAIAIWRWSQRLRKQVSNPMEGGQLVLDPIQLFNNYGHCNCGVVSGLNNTFWLNMGWKARYVQLGDHTVCETSWDGGETWHMFDASMSFYCFNDQGAVASVREIETHPHFYLRNFAPECGTNPVAGPDDHQGWRQASDRPVHYRRTLANGYDSFKAPNHISDGNLYANWGHRFVLNLRPDEYYTRSFGPLEGITSPEHTFRPLPDGKDPQRQHSHLGIRANGFWRYAPDLRDPEASDLVYHHDNLRWGDTQKGFAVRADDSRRPGTAVFRVSAANLVTSAKLWLSASRVTASDSVTVEVSTTAGIACEPVWQLGREGVAIPAEVDLRSHVAGVTDYRVRVRLSGPGAGLEAMAIETITQINRASLPRLARGANRVQLTLGDQVETIQFQPSVVEGRHRETVAEEHLIDVEKTVGYYKPILRPAENLEPAHVTWKMSTPTPMVSVRYGGKVCVKSPHDRATLLHSWDGGHFAADFEKTSGDAPFDLVVDIPVAVVPPNTQAAYLRYEFATKDHARSYAGPGIQTARMTVEHQPRLRGFTPIEVTYCWVEHREEGDVERQHTERVSSPAHEYVLHVGGYRDPTIKWLRVNLLGSAPAGEKAKTGYADGQDVGPGKTRTPTVYRWGKNLVRGRSYTLTGSQSTKNPDGGHDLSDGVIAPPDEYVSQKFMPTSVMFEQNSTAVATFDLEGRASVAGVRVCAGQEPGFRLAYPERITVETSADGEQFAVAGQAEHHQVFDPPADFAPWEHDDSPQYAGLPAGGRLAYAYRVLFPQPVSARYIRVTCTAQRGWGMLLSEIQAFDRVAVTKNVPPLVFLPPLLAE